MMRALAILVLLLAACALGLGVAFPGLPEEPLSVTRRLNVGSGPTLRPGEGTVEAVRFLRTLRADPAPPSPEPL
ncbi:hypothetical protein, partial [Brevundimonas sp.]|uniref:hypothetical protein n=1 Tax=Brevundimonas sp. TaxID=1871086 RepID=UPI0025B8632E